MRRELVRQIGAARPQIFVEVRKGDRRIAAVAAQIVDEFVAGRILRRRQIGADIGEAALIGRLALRIGISAAQVEFQRVELEFAHQLGVDQLAFVPGGVLLHDVAADLVRVGAKAQTRLFQRVANIEAGPAQLVIAQLESETDQAVHDDAVVGNHAVVIGLRIARQVEVERGLLQRIAGAPLVADPRGRDDPQLAIGKGDRRAAGDPGRPVDRDMVVLLQQRGFGVYQLHLDRFQIVLAVIGALQDWLAAGKSSFQQRRNIAGAVVEPRPVGVAAIIGIAELVRRLAVPADAAAEGQERFARGRFGREVDHAAAEFAGEVRRIAFLDQRRVDHVRREDIERNDALQRLGAGQRRTVEQRERITVAKAADINKAAADDRQTGDALQRPRNIAFAGARDVGRRQDRDDLGGRADDIGGIAAGDDDFLIGAAGDRNIAVFVLRRGIVGDRLVGGGRFGGHGRGVGCGRAAADILGECRGRYQPRAEEEQAGKDRPLGHVESPQIMQEGSGPARQACPLPSGSRAIRSSGWRCSCRWRCRSSPSTSCRSNPGTTCHWHRGRRRHKRWCQRRRSASWH